MTPIHLHLCFSMCMYSSFTPQMQISTCLRPDFVCKAIVPTLPPGRTKKKVSRERRDGAMWHILERPPLSPCAPLDAIRFLCQVLGQGQLLTPPEKKTQWINHWKEKCRLFGRVSGSCPKILKKSPRNLRKGKQQDLNEFTSSTWLWKVKNSTFPNVVPTA